MKSSDKLTFILRLKICWNVLTYRSGHKHSAQLKGLKLFEVGYAAGFLDATPKLKGRIWSNCKIASLVTSQTTKSTI